MIHLVPESQIQKGSEVRRSVSRYRATMLNSLLILPILYWKGSKNFKTFDVLAKLLYL